MAHRWLAWIVLILAAALAGSPAAYAQTSGQAGGQPDLMGTWTPPLDGRHRRFSPEDAPMQPWALERFRANREGIRGQYLQGQPYEDPFMYCMPSGTPRAYTAPLPFDIVQAPGRVYMIFQTNPLVRYIYTDGRGHPEGFPVTFMGHSIGRWDGDTLVVDTISIDETSWLDTVGTPHSDVLRIEERIRRAARDRLEIDFLFEDSKAYTRPWRGKKVYLLDTDWEMVPGLHCEDRFKQDFSRRVLRGKKDWIEFESK